MGVVSRVLNVDGACAAGFNTNKKSATSISHIKYVDALLIISYMSIERINEILSTRRRPSSKVNPPVVLAVSPLDQPIEFVEFIEPARAGVPLENYPESLRNDPKFIEMAKSTPEYTRVKSRYWVTLQDSPDWVLGKTVASVMNPDMPKEYNNIIWLYTIKNGDGSIIDAQIPFYY